MEEKRIQTNIYSMKTIRDMFSQKKTNKKQKNNNTCYTQFNYRGVTCPYDATGTPIMEILNSQLFIYNSATPFIFI